MILNLCSLAFNLNIDGGGATPAWGTEMGQGEGYKFSFEDMDDFFTAMVYKAVPDIENVTCPLGKGGNQRADYDFVIASLFSKVFVNGQRVNDAQFLVLIVKKINGDHHVGRRTLKYNPRMTYNGQLINDDCYKKIAQTLGIVPDAGWFVNEINVNNQDEIHFSAIVVDGEKARNYPNNNIRKAHLESLIPHEVVQKKYSVRLDNDNSRQTIYYGAPGTGKSNKIDELTNEENRIRTTFHPDSDYSTFVGAYKPTMKETPVFNTTNGQLLKYEEQITYKFVPQAFLKAYEKAWIRWAENDKNPYYLVIEEINRGNCAQIFGDLFQLLDRAENGESKYTITPDDDIRAHLKSIFENYENLPDKIKGGEEMRLPSNLYIWATMNTSDQSLFPIDSAFKRRWEWEYVPIENAGKGFYIEIGDKKYDWWNFIDTINNKIDRITGSEDKKLGYWFAKPAGESLVIDDKQFVSKVLFYLWNDVYKDYVDSNQSIFRTKDGENSKKVAFTEFFGSDKIKKLQAFMDYNGIEPKEQEEQQTETEDSADLFSELNEK